MIGDRVEAAVRDAMKGQPRDAIEAAVRRAVGDGVFLFSLALGLNVVALEMRQAGGPARHRRLLLDGLPAGWTARRGPSAGGGRDVPSASVPTRGRCGGPSSIGCVSRSGSRTRPGRRSSGGSSVATTSSSRTQPRRGPSHVDMVERLASLAETMASTGGPMARSRRSTRTASGSLTERVAERVARLADDARVRAYEILGDRPKAVEIMERRLTVD